MKAVLKPAKEITQAQAAKLKITPAIAKRVAACVKPGLTEGVGEPIPGQMCVEAAVCYAIGLPHGDDPRCVGQEVRNIKIALNDSDGWSTGKTRAAGLLKLAIAQLGSNKIPNKKFLKALAVKTVKRFMVKGDMPSAGLLGKLVAKAKKPSGLLEIAVLVSNLDGYKEIGSAAISMLGLRRGEDAINNALQMMTGDPDSSSQAQLVMLADLITEVLVELKSPGAKFLHFAK